jgi:hypothetical protein
MPNHIGDLGRPTDSSHVLETPDKHDMKAVRTVVGTVAATPRRADDGVGPKRSHTDLGAAAKLGEGVKRHDPGVEAVNAHIENLTRVDRFPWVGKDRSATSTTGPKGMVDLILEPRID